MNKLQNLVHQLTTALESAQAALEDSHDYPITQLEVQEALDAVSEFEYAGYVLEPVDKDVVLEWLHHNQGFVNTQEDFVSFARYIEQQHGFH